MERRNFIGVCTVTGLTLMGFKAAKFYSRGIEELEDFIPSPKSAEIMFYGLFKEEHINREFLPHSRKVILGGLIGLPVFVDDKGYCTFNSDNRHIGYVKTIDNNGILVHMSKRSTKVL